MQKKVYEKKVINLVAFLHNFLEFYIRFLVQKTGEGDVKRLQTKWQKGLKRLPIFFARASSNEESTHVRACNQNAVWK